MFEQNNNIFEGTKKEILEKLKSLAKPGCNKCYGRGYEFYKENKGKKQREYIPCHKCIKNKI